MEEWYSKDFVLELSIYEQLNDIYPKFSNKPSRPYLGCIDIDLYKSLNKNKNKIADTVCWEKWSRLVNPYEKITNVGSARTRSSKGPGHASRAYYKMYEIIKYFEHEMKLENLNTVKSAHFCEAPGGFIKAMLAIYPKIDWYAQTLYRGTNSLKVDPSLNIPEKWVRAGDGTGDLYKLENIIAFSKVVKEKSGTGAKIITADGGFDVSFDPNNQEQLSLRLIYSEIVGALHCQEVGGSFVCKIFDSVTKPTCQLILKLGQYYEKLYIIKPRTSRYSNSEKYLVAINFTGISERELLMFNNIIEKWGDSIETKNDYCRDFGIDLKEDIVKVKCEILKEYNEKIMKNQLKYITLSLKGSTFNINYEKQLEAFQNRRAYEYCEAVELIQDTYKNCIHFKTKPLGKVKKCEKCLKLLI